MLTWIIGLQSAGALKALRNMVMPAGHIYTALFVLMVPSFVNARQIGRIIQSLFVSLGVMIFYMGIYWIFLALFGDIAMQWLYDGRYDIFVFLLTAIGAQTFIAGLSSVFGALLRAWERPDLVFWAYSAAAAIVAAFAYTLIMKYGVEGAIAIYILGMLAATVIMAIMTAFLLTKHAAAR
jgi:O-antigen/teichoic acid export membrane protein